MPRKTTQPPTRRRLDGKGPGGSTPADRLLRAWLDDDYDRFDELGEEFIAGGRDGVLVAAVRKLAEKYDDEEVEAFAAVLTELAEVAEGQHDFDHAALVLLPVLATGALPDAAMLARGLAGAGVFPAEAEVRFAEGWRSADAMISLAPAAVRRVLLDVAAQRPPADLPALPPDRTEGGLAVLLGAVVFRTAPPEDDPDADSELRAAAEETRAREQAEAFEAWRASLDPEAIAGALVLPLCAPSELGDEIAALLEGAEATDPPLEEILDFIEAAEAEAGGEEVVARLTPREGGVELAVLTRSGRELDRRVFDIAEEGPTAEEVRRAVEELVDILDDTE